jgi:hypothetical protein
MAEHYVEVPDGHTAALGVDGTAKQADGNHSAKAGVYNPKAMACPVALALGACSRACRGGIVSSSYSPTCKGGMA